MLVRQAFVALAVVAFLSAAAGAPARPVLAGADVCPEPNGDYGTACFLGPDGPAPGFLDTFDDVDRYRLQLPPESMVMATLGSLPADYSLRLDLSDGTLAAEATEPGLADKVLKADGLQPGTYFLSVFSLRGESNPARPYLLSVSYSTSIVLTTPTTPVGPDGEPQSAFGYVPAPASAYGLRPPDVTGTFVLAARDESEDGRQFRQLLVATDVFICPEFTPDTACSRNGVGMIDTLILILPYGSNDDVGIALNRQLDLWRKEGWNVQPAVGWGSEQVYSVAHSRSGVTIRGLALRHRNALVLMTMTGHDQHATWDVMSHSMRAVEARIHSAVQ
jgi:hypothetical protein